jgi:protein phosphatase
MDCNLSIKAYVITNKGLIRENNEDNFYVNGRYMNETERECELEFSVESSKYNQIFAVCDGMGGEAKGELASFIAAKTLENLDVDLNGEEAPNISYKTNVINNYVRLTNLYLCEVMQKDIKGRMGSTLSGLHIFGDNAITFNIGDSRVYILRDNELRQLTLDHTEAQRLIRLGVIDEEQAKQHKSKHQLTRHFGILAHEGVLEADIGDELKIKKDDVFLICSDGLTDMLADTNIKDVLTKTQNTNEIHISLVQEALKMGGYDNITVIILKVC